MSPEKSPPFNVEALRNQISRTRGDAGTIVASEHGIAYHEGNVEKTHAKFHSLIVIDGYAKHAGAVHESIVIIRLPEEEVAEEVHAAHDSEVWVIGDTKKAVAEQDGKIYISGLADNIEVVGNGIVETGYKFSEEELKKYFNL